MTIAADGCGVCRLFFFPSFIWLLVGLFWGFGGRGGDAIQVQWYFDFVVREGGEWQGVSYYEGWVAGECGHSIIPFSFTHVFVGLMVVFLHVFYTLLTLPLCIPLFPFFFLHTISLFLYTTTYTGLCLCVLIFFLSLVSFLLLCVSCFFFAMYWLH
jgi:hypothetical protein